MGGMWIEKATRGRVVATAIIAAVLASDALAGVLLYPDWQQLTRSVALFLVIGIITVWVHVC
jgi:hypothetical protein